LPKLKEQGIDYNLSSRAQKIAAVPEAEFEATLGGWRDTVKREYAAFFGAVPFMACTAHHIFVTLLCAQISRDLPRVRRSPTVDDILPTRSAHGNLAFALNPVIELSPVKGLRTPDFSVAAKLQCGA
jgi:hypothetical protein